MVNHVSPEYLGTIKVTKIILRKGVKTDPAQSPFQPAVTG